eukprot:gene6621-19201_t
MRFDVDKASILLGAPQELPMMPAWAEMPGMPGAVGAMGDAGSIPMQYWVIAPDAQALRDGVREHAARARGQVAPPLAQPPRKRGAGARRPAAPHFAALAARSSGIRRAFEAEP